MRTYAPRNRHDPARGPLWLAVALIAATALAALVIMVVAAKAAILPLFVPHCSLDDRAPAQTPPSGAGSDMVPAGAIRLLACRYNGLNATASTPQFGLEGQYATADPGTIAQIAGELNALQPSTGTTSCPMDDGSLVQLTFAYASGPPDVVDADLTGCEQVSNGVLERPGRSVAGQLAALATPVKGLEWATVVGKARRPASRVLAVNSSNAMVAMAQLRGHRFRFRIAAPGRYRFELMGSGRELNKVVARTSATVSAGHTTSIVFGASLRRPA